MSQNRYSNTIADSLNKSNHESRNKEVQQVWVSCFNNYIFCLSVSQQHCTVIYITKYVQHNKNMIILYKITGVVI